MSPWLLAGFDSGRFGDPSEGQGLMRVPQHLQGQRAGEAGIYQPRLDKRIYFPGSN